VTPADLRKLLEGATPGPWVADAELEEVSTPGGLMIADVFGESGTRGATILLIAAAVNALPALLAVAEAAEAAINDAPCVGTRALRAALAELERAK
jgi:hypothetical protein